MGDAGKGDRNVGEVVGRTALEEFEKTLKARTAAEESGVEDPDNRPDEFSHWKRQANVENLHRGLLEVSSIAEAAVEASLQFRAELRRAVPVIERTTAIVEAMGPRVESTLWLAHKIDDELAKANKTIQELRIAVQGVQTNIDAMKGPIAQIPAIKDLLGEILARLPDRATKA